MIVLERPDLWLGLEIGLIVAAVVVVLAIVSDRHIRKDFPERKP